MKAVVSRAVLAGVLAYGLGAAPVFAQTFNDPPADVPGGGDPQSETGALALRMNRLEDQLRRANGQIEELQNQNRRLAEDLRKFREDVEYRLGNKSGAGGPAPDIAAAPAAPQPTPTPARTKRSDAFDPDADPNAPGAPKKLGETAPSAPLVLSSHAHTEDPALKPLPTPGLTPQRDPKAADAGEPSFVASGLPFSDAKAQFKSALDAYNAGQYADAEAGFKAYLDANKGAATAADAIFYIGETYMQRARPREAAEQYLKVSTEYPKSRFAPDAMVRLGLALAKLGNNEQACATFAEVGKRYPTARPAVKKAADREIAAHRCS